MYQSMEHNRQPEMNYWIHGLTIFIEGVKKTGKLHPCNEWHWGNKISICQTIKILHHEEKSTQNGLDLNVRLDKTLRRK